MRSIFAKLLYEMEKGHDTMLATIVADDGSAPRGKGSQMLVGAQGRLVGTIGGGAVELRSEQMAIELLEKKQSGLHEFHLQKNKIEDIGMVCGGDVMVLFTRIPGTDARWNSLAQKAMQCFA